MKDIWHTIGLRGTASNEYSVNDLFVPEERAMHRDDPRYRRADGLLYRYTSNQLYSIGFGGVGLGIARGMIDCVSRRCRPPRFPRRQQTDAGE